MQSQSQYQKSNARNPSSGTGRLPWQAHARCGRVAGAQKRLAVARRSAGTAVGPTRGADPVGVAELRRAEQPRQAGVAAALYTDIAAQNTAAIVAYRVGAGARNRRRTRLVEHGHAVTRVRRAVEIAVTEAHAVATVPRLRDPHAVAGVGDGDRQSDAQLVAAALHQARARRSRRERRHALQRRRIAECSEIAWVHVVCVARGAQIAADALEAMRF